MGEVSRNIWRGEIVWDTCGRLEEVTKTDLGGAESVLMGTRLNWSRKAISALLLEHDNEPYGFFKSGRFLNRLSNHDVFMKGHAPLNSSLRCFISGKYVGYKIRFSCKLINAVVDLRNVRLYPRYVCDVVRDNQLSEIYYALGKPFLLLWILTLKIM
jgi:hypothetical protein